MKAEWILIVTKLAVFLVLAQLTCNGIVKAAGSIDEQLMDAIKGGDAARVKALLDKGADVNARDKGGTTALMHAADKGYSKVVKLLLEKGAEVNAESTAGWTALIWGATSSSTGGIDVVKLLVAKGADVNAKDQTGMTALLGASRQGHLRAVKVLLEKGADVNGKDRGGASALMEASKEGHLDIVKLLLKKGADANAKDSEGRTALMQASDRGHSKVANLLKGHSTTPSSGSAPSADANLIDTWELLYQVDEKGQEERPFEGTRTLIEFTDKGQVIFSRMDKRNSDQMKSRTGKYALDGNKISITDDVGNTVYWPYEISGDKLVIEMPGVNNKKYYWARFR